MKNFCPDCKKTVETQPYGARNEDANTHICADCGQFCEENVEKDLLEETIQSAKSDIMEYESDTFSAHSAELTENEARQIVARILASRMQSIDGLQINAFLSDIRGES